MTSRKGNKIANQFVIDDDLGNTFFQSYNSIICKVNFDGTFLDSKFWDYSTTTSKYRNEFLNETKKETLKKIDCGLYKLEDLNSDNISYETTNDNPNTWRS